MPIRILMANIPPPPPAKSHSLEWDFPLHESEGFLPVADASCSVTIFLPARYSLINGTTTKIPHIFLFPSHPRYSVALRAPYESLSATAEKCEPRKVVRIFFVAAEEEKKDEPLRHKVNLSRDKFPIYACINVCANDTLPQGSAACAARRFRPYAPQSVLTFSPRKIISHGHRVAVLCGDPDFSEHPSAIA